MNKENLLLEAQMKVKDFLSRLDDDKLFTEIDSFFKKNFSKSYYSSDDYHNEIKLSFKPERKSGDYYEANVSFNLSLRDKDNIIFEVIILANPRFADIWSTNEENSKSWKFEKIFQKGNKFDNCMNEIKKELNGIIKEIGSLWKVRPGK
jgi:hypothetical protein